MTNIELIQYYARLQCGKELDKLRLIDYAPDWVYWIEYLEANEN